jgi:hypothetical protein
MQLAKEIGITQKSAWFVLGRLREACGDDGPPEVLDKITDIVLAYRPKPKSKSAKKRARKAAKKAKGEPVRIRDGGIAKLRGTVEIDETFGGGPSIEQQIAELKAAGWIPLTRTCWKAPAGSGCAGCFLGPHGAWKAMKRSEASA